MPPSSYPGFPPGKGQGHYVGSLHPIFYAVGVSGLLRPRQIGQTHYNMFLVIMAILTRWYNTRTTVPPLDHAVGYSVLGSLQVVGSQLRTSTHPI